MWGSHVVHHSSEEYNLTTALRQTSTPAIFAWVITAPLAFLGVPPEMLIACASLNLVYQFWVHTRHIDKMPAWFEAVFVTPSHHRVHHALNRDYIDKNFAGVFILWDKWFGSFQAEKTCTPVVFGISSQLACWNPITANFRVYGLLWQDFKVTKGIKNKLKTLLSPPSWRSLEAKGLKPRQYVTSKNITKYDTNLTSGQKQYLLFQHLAVIIMTLFWLLNLVSFSLGQLIATCTFAIFSLYVISTLQESKAKAVLLELIRLGVSSWLIWLLAVEQNLRLGLAVSYLTVSSVLLITLYRPAFVLTTEQN